MRQARAMQDPLNGMDRRTPSFPCMHVLCVEQARALFCDPLGSTSAVLLAPKTSSIDDCPKLTFMHVWAHSTYVSQSRREMEEFFYFNHF